MKNDKLTQEERIEKDLLDEKKEEPYQSDIMPDDPRHGVISSRPDLFEEDEKPLLGDGTVSEETDQYDEENIDEYKTPN